MKCDKCDGEGFFEVDRSYRSYGGICEVYEDVICDDCDGTGEVDNNNSEDVNSEYE